MSRVKYKVYVLVINVLFVVSGFAGTKGSCLQVAKTQLEMNQCAGTSYKLVDTELNRVYKLIRQQYKKNPQFLAKLKISQLAWIKLRDANMNMQFPAKNKRLEYGSVYPMCSSLVEKKIVLRRIVYLKQWLKGVEEGDVCSGSIKLSTETQTK
ncbi:hypothetical protein MNBD_GAMMA12-1750 [hydrothermal vent metagenome]|uniref:Lysozyme inhibitor LprI-like N-terminal domain-containing protein n=1 Tax=hydrothermal vent metagenome TaxID=652676 RepID=A0A3B0YAL9_9ZZZZ